MPTRYTTVRIPLDLWADIREAADRDRRTAAQWVRLALEDAVRRAIPVDEKQKEDHMNEYLIHYEPAHVPTDGGTTTTAGATLTIERGGRGVWTGDIIPRVDGMPSMDAWVGDLAYETIGDDADHGRWMQALEAAALSGADGHSGTLRVPID